MNFIMQLSGIFYSEKWIWNLEMYATIQNFQKLYFDSGSSIIRNLALKYTQVSTIIRLSRKEVDTLISSSFLLLLCLNLGFVHFGEAKFWIVIRYFGYGKLREAGTKGGEGWLGFSFLLKRNFRPSFTCVEDKRMCQVWWLSTYLKHNNRVFFVRCKQILFCQL